MARLMSVAFTEQAVVERRKTVTRRAGWWTNVNGRRLVVPGDTITLCRKVMGRRKGEPLVRLVDVEVLDVRREPLDLMVRDRSYGFAEVIREGFPFMDPAEFLNRYFIEAQQMCVTDEVTRIEWRYLDEAGLF